MKSIQNQYIALIEGRMTQANFMRNVRMALPQYISNVNSFEDTVKILKNKRILTELGPAAQQMAGNPDEEAEYRASIVKKKPKEEEKPEDKKDKKKTNEDNFGSEDQSSIDYTNDFNREVQRLISNLNNPEIEEFIDNIDPEVTADIIMTSDSPEEAIAKFVEMFEQHEDEQIQQQYDAEQDSPEMYKFQDYEGGLSEAKKKKAKKEEKPYNPNAIHPSELRMGIKVEMEHTNGDPKKAEKIALDHLDENPYYYTALKLAGVDAPPSSKAKAVAPKKIKKKDATEMTDPANQMQKVKLMKEALEKMIRAELRKY